MDAPLSFTRRVVGPSIIIAEEVLGLDPSLFVENVIADGLSGSRNSPWLDEAVAEILARWSTRTADEVAQVPEILSYRELSRRFTDHFRRVVPATENVMT